MPKFDDQTLLVLFGVVFLGMGLAARLGMWKAWYWRTRGGAYGYIPLGLLFIVYSLRPELTALFGTELAFFVVFGLMLLVGVWWSFAPPDFMKPGWVRWVEDQPERVQEAMRERADGDTEWREHLESREAVEQWARRLKNRRG